MKLALCIGVNQYRNYPGDNLAGCVPDAEAMATFFRKLGCEVVILKDEKATDLNIIAQLNNFRQEVEKTQDHYYVGFWHSSHGSHYSRPEEIDGLGEGTCCFNLADDGQDWTAGFIKDATQRDLLNSFPPWGTVEAGLDTCYSGGMDRDFGRHFRGERNRFLHNPGNGGKVLRLSNSSAGHGLNPNIVMWQSCSEAQTSADSYIAGGAHGAFTYFWEKAARSSPEVSRVEILLKTREFLARNRYSQFPRLKAWNAKAQAKVGA